VSLLAVTGLVKRFGGLIATDGVDLTVEPGEVHAVIGPNGAGKTTLINQLSGELRPDAGTIRLDGMDVTAMPVHRRALLGLGRSFQITSVFPDFTVLVNVVLAVQAHAGHSFSFWRPVLNETALTQRARVAIDQVGLTARTDVPVAALAHGERRQLEMAMTLATAPKVLLLDEPMAGMSLTESERLVTLLTSLKKQYGILLVEHDMDAVFKLADRISVLVYGRVIACGDPESIRNNPDVRTAYLGEHDLVA
jgi:branched-chain amino acid transport system ATP-binding protein